MIAEPIKIRHLAISTDHILGIDDQGQVWYRKRLPAPPYAHATASERRKKDEEEEQSAREPWRKMCMNGCIVGDEIPPSKDIPPEIVGKPVNPKPENKQYEDDDFFGEGLGGLAMLSNLSHVE